MADLDLHGVWTVLATERGDRGLVVLEAQKTVSAGEVLVGIDDEDRRHLLIPLLPGEAARTDNRGRGVRMGRIKDSGTTYLTIYCLLPELHGVFTQFCNELLATISESTGPAKEAARALDRWRALFSEAQRALTLTDEQLTGLIGEILVVDQLLEKGASTDLRFWEGPLGGVHDMRSPSYAIEVKTTLIREGRIISISSIDQLQEPEGADLTLIHTRLQPDPGGVNLPQLVERLNAHGAEGSEIWRRLRELGLRSEADLQEVAGKRFKTADSRAYDVTTDAFPRLLRSHLPGGDFPAGVLRINYSIDLTNEPPKPMTVEEGSNFFGAMAEEVRNGMDS